MAEIHVIHNDADVLVWTALVSLIDHVFAEYLGIATW